MQAYGLGRNLAVAIFAVAAIALASSQTGAQARGDHPKKFDIEEAEPGRAVPLPPIVNAKEPDTEQDKTEHQERVEREKANSDYNRRIAEAAERQADAAEKRSSLAIWQVAIAGAQTLILLGILVALIAVRGARAARD